MVFAPFSATAQNTVEQGDIAFLGLYFNNTTPEMALEKNLPGVHGGLATDVFEGSPADKAGLKAGDYLIAIDEHQSSTSQNLQQIVEMYKPCDRVLVTYIRDGETITVSTVLAKRPPSEYFQGSIKGYDAFLGLMFAYRHEGEGLNISRAIDNSASAEMGLGKYDILTSINGVKVERVSDVQKALAGLNPGDEVRVEYLRNEQPRKASAKLKSKADTYLYIECEEPELVADDLSDEELALLEEKAAMIANPDNLGIGSVNFFPNPSNGQFDLKFNLYEEGDVNIRIFSGDGRLVYTEKINGFSGYFNGNVDISNNARGVYFLIVDQNGKSVSKKVVLQ